MKLNLSLIALAFLAFATPAAAQSVIKAGQPVVVRAPHNGLRVATYTAVPDSTPTVTLPASARSAAGNVDFLIGQQPEGDRSVQLYASNSGGDGAKVTVTFKVVQNAPDAFSCAGGQAVLVTVQADGSQLVTCQ